MLDADQQDRTLNEPGNDPHVSLTRESGPAQLSYVIAVPSSGVSSIVVNCPVFVGPSTRSEPMAAVQYPVR